MQCTQPYELIPHLLNIYLLSILIISYYLRQLFQAYIENIIEVRRSLPIH
jgi:hypothetical protein